MTPLDQDLAVVAHRLLTSPRVASIARDVILFAEQTVVGDRWGYGYRAVHVVDWSCGYPTFEDAQTALIRTLVREGRSDLAAGVAGVQSP